MDLITFCSTFLAYLVCCQTHFKHSSNRRLKSVSLHRIHDWDHSESFRILRRSAVWIPLLSSSPLTL